jgi:RnfABCDGE-type electron transport complex B subunit
MPVEMVLPVVMLGGTGLLFGAVIAIASKKLQVYEHPRVGQILTVLPGTNCKECGYGSCLSFARAVVEGKATSGGCVPGGLKTLHAVADIIGLTTGPTEPVMAVVHCSGGTDQASDRAQYMGIQDCHAAVLTGNGAKTCQDGCLGLGSCVRSCTAGAIRITANKVAVVDPDKCTGCGDCVGVCPRSIISLIPSVYKIFLACSNHDRGTRVKKYCAVGCTACALCVKASPSGAISMENNLPVLDYTKEENFIPAAYRCPSHCFVDLVKTRSKANIDTKCNGCGACIEVCPVPEVISGEPNQRHVINKQKCIGCGICLGICPVHAISLWGMGVMSKSSTGKR